MLQSWNWEVTENENEEIFLFLFDFLNSIENKLSLSSSACMVSCDELIYIVVHRGKITSKTSLSGQVVRFYKFRGAGYLVSFSGG